MAATATMDIARRMGTSCASYPRPFRYLPGSRQWFVNWLTHILFLFVCSNLGDGARVQKSPPRANFPLQPLPLPPRFNPLVPNCIDRAECVDHAGADVALVARNRTRRLDQQAAHLVGRELWIAR